MKQILVLGAGGFIGSHLITRLKQNGHHVIGIDLKYPELFNFRLNNKNLVLKAVILITR